MTFCRVEGCGRPVQARGWCHRHYAYWHKYGREPIPPGELTPVGRFMVKVVQESSGCWRWTGTLRGGYGRFRDGDRLHQAHRWSYEHHVGAIPEGLHLDHLCRNRACVNPAHLEPVTPSENSRRSPIHPSVTRTPERDADTGRFVA